MIWQKKCIESWKKYCPDYEIIEWNEKNFDVSANAYTAEAYAAKKWAFVSDYARLKIVFDHGGIYFDTDVELIKPIHSLVEKGSFMGFDEMGYVATGLGFAAEAGHPVLKEMLKDYEGVCFLQPDGKYNMKACPVTNTATLERMGMHVCNTNQVFCKMCFLPHDYLCPMDYHTGEMTITENTYSIHHYCASWHSKTEKRCTRKKMYFIQKYGTSEGTKRYEQWRHKRRYWFWFLENGFIALFQKAIKAIVKK